MSVPLAADRALIRRLRRVGTEVLSQRVRLTELPRTNRALKRCFPRMSADVRP